MRERTKVILVTDGDTIAKKAIEEAVRKLGLRCISRSAGNPTPYSGEVITKLIKKAKYNPVVVMLDDKGFRGKGKGERAAEIIAKDPEIEIIGAIAVASNTYGVKGTHVDFCITKNGEKISLPVDKAGNCKTDGQTVLQGDTVDVLEDLGIPVIIGIGDPGKMDYFDNYKRGAPITTLAIKEILYRNGIRHENR